MTVYVCFERDIECGSNPASWCATCPQRRPAISSLPPSAPEQQNGLPQDLRKRLDQLKDETDYLVEAVAALVGQPKGCELPELPSSFAKLPRLDGSQCDAYTPNQMRAYARAARQAPTEDGHRDDLIALLRKQVDDGIARICDLEDRPGARQAPDGVVARDAAIDYVMVREALSAAQRSHGVMLTSYPPRDPWIENRVAEKLLAAIAAIDAHIAQEKAQ